MIRIFVGFQVSSIGVQLGKKHSELQTQGKNGHGEPIFLWQFLIIFLYMAYNCAKYETNLDSTKFL